MSNTLRQSTVTYKEFAEEFHDEFDKKERVVIDFIDKNPGVTKQDVVNALDGKLSRVTIFNTIKALNKMRIINIEKQKPNSQTHKLFFDRNHPLISTMRSIDSFQETYWAAMKKLQTKYQKEYPRVAKGERLEFDVITDFLFLFFVHYVRKCSILGSVRVKKFSDDEAISKRLAHLIYNRLSDTVMFLPNPYDWPTTSILEIYTPEAKIPMLELMKKYCRKYTLEKEFNTMIKLARDLDQVPATPDYQPKGRL